MAPDAPTVSQLKTLQSFSGDVNWLATQTRPDLSYVASLISSASSKYSAWSENLDKKILKYLQEAKIKGCFCSCARAMAKFYIWTDAGLAGITHTNTD